MMSTISVGRRPNLSAIIPKQKCANRTKSQGDKDSFRHGRNFSLELGRDGADAKGKDEEVKGIERPAQKAGNKSIPLHRRQSAKMADKFH